MKSETKKLVFYAIYDKASTSGICFYFINFLNPRFARACFKNFINLFPLFIFYCFVYLVFSSLNEINIMEMKIDSEADTLFIKLVEDNHEVRTVNLSDEAAPDFESRELHVGIEILEANEVIGKGELPKVV